MLTHSFSPRHADQLHALIKLNRKLDSAGVPHLMNEACIESLHAELMSYPDHESAYFWLLYGRIAEAALLVAGHYADNCEYAAAGDLLVNPRRIYVLRKDSAELELKNRHQSISEQFMPQSAHPQEFRRNFRSSMNLYIEAQPLLPLMANTLAQSGFFCQSYLLCINERMKKIADAMAFLMAWPVDDALDLQKRLAASTPDCMRFIHNNLCRFSADLFHAMGAELLGIEGDIPIESPLLKRSWCKPARCSQAGCASIGAL